jgi:opacity protein-like surface antigen
MVLLLRRPKWSILALLSCLLLPAAASADGLRFTPFLGYRAGGEFRFADTPATLDLDETESYGFIVSADADDALEFSFSQQPTQLNASGGVQANQVFDIDVMNFMVGGKKILSRESGSFVSGMVGITHFDPHEANLSSDTRFALGAGAGIDFPFSKNIGLRLEGRGIATLLNSSGGLFCSSASGCAVYADSDVLLQFEFISGLSFRF